MNEEIKQMFEQFSQVVNGLDEKLNKILDAYTEAETAYNDKVNHDEWETNHGEKLHKYDAELKALNGDDFDIIDSARKEYTESYGDMDQDEYVDTLVEHIEESLDNLKTALANGDVAEAAHIAEEVTDQAEEVAEKVDEDAHEEVAPDSAPDAGAETNADEDIPAPVTEEIPDTPDTSEETDDIDEFEKSLLEEAEKSKPAYGQDKKEDKDEE